MMSYFSQIVFDQPLWLIALLIIPVLIANYWINNKKQNASLQISSLEWTASLKPCLITRLRHLPFILRTIALFLLIIVMARPQIFTKQKHTNIEGIDIIMALDVSGSMKAMDLKPNRLEAAKEVAINFIDGRKNDRIGLVIFSGEAFTQCPLTTDHNVLKNLFEPIESGMIEDGTAIGDGLATAINRIKDSEAISRVIILLTDGIQNSGSIDPISAANIAKEYGIRVYTIGAGSQGTAPMAMQTPFGEQIVDVDVKIDEEILQKIASTTDAKYFRAVDNKSLEKIYSEIDLLEKSKIDVNIFQNKSEEFLGFAIAAILILLLELLLRITIFKTKP